MWTLFEYFTSKVKWSNTFPSGKGLNRSLSSNLGCVVVNDVAAEETNDAGSYNATVQVANKQNVIVNTKHNDERSVFSDLRKWDSMMRKNRR